MTGPRTLPIRVEPLPSEALDSWLEALAFRMRMPAGELVASIGLKRRARRSTPDVPQPDWMTRLQPDEVCTIAAATGIAPSQVTSMTLAAYDGRGLFIDPQSGQVNRRRIWGRGAGSRYCPSCLAETGGRWSLSWRLGWSFACLRHHCLLSDACPKCNRIQHVYRYWGKRLIHPAYCGYPAAGRSPSTRCGTDLSQAAAAKLGDGHPAMNAQRIILGVIETGQATFGAYVRQPTASARALADMKAIAGRALAASSAYGLGNGMPEDLFDLYQRALDGQPVNQREPRAALAAPGLMAPSLAAVAAVGALAAIQVLGQPSVQEAGQALRWLTVDARSRGRTITATTARDWGRGTSPVLEGAALASIRPLLGPSSQLRYRVMSSCPSYPDEARGLIGVLARKTPTLLWPLWALRFALPHISMTFLRAACSALILLPGTRSTNSGAAAILGHATDRGGITHILQRLSDSPCGEQVIAAVTRLADYLTVSQVPIDYQRRRTLDYAGILPRAEWDQICRVSAARPGRENKVHIARAYLSHRLSSLPCGSPPAGLAVTPYDFRTYVAQFPAQLTPELDAQLEAAGRRFLAACGINGEPLTWQPPLDLIHDLELPGPDPDSISLDDLHRLIRGGKSPAMAARHLGTTTDAVRVVLAEHPAPARAARGKERTLRET